MNNCACGICFENINTKCTDVSIELECGHWFHSKCVRPWCKRCIDIENQPSCPFCRQTITNEYLDILGINLYSTNIDIILMTNTIELFTYIIKNKIYEDENKLTKLIERYPNEIENIMVILNNFMVFNLINY
jgi:hypothetical protein